MPDIAHPAPDWALHTARRLGSPASALAIFAVRGGAVDTVHAAECVREVVAELEGTDAEGAAAALYEWLVEQPLFHETASPCMRSGACCKRMPCGYGERRKDGEGCRYLESIGNVNGTPVYECGRARWIMAHDPHWRTYPAFGGGCGSALFNEARTGILQATWDSDGEYAMKNASIPSSWIALHPTKRLDARFWTRVAELAEARGIARDDREAVKGLIQECEGDFGREDEK